MNQNEFANIAQLEADLWSAADNLRANSKLTAGEYCMPVLGIIFLAHATNRYNEALKDSGRSGGRQDAEATTHSSGLQEASSTIRGFRRRRTSETGGI